MDPNTYPGCSMWRYWSVVLWSCSRPCTRTGPARRGWLWKQSGKSLHWQNHWCSSYSPPLCLMLCSWTKPSQSHSWSSWRSGEIDRKAPSHYRGGLRLHLAWTGSQLEMLYTEKASVRRKSVLKNKTHTFIWKKKTQLKTHWVIQLYASGLAFKTFKNPLFLSKI